jgi:hypothetical protein
MVPSHPKRSFVRRPRSPILPPFSLLPQPHPRLNLHNMVTRSIRHLQYPPAVASTSTTRVKKSDAASPVCFILAMGRGPAGGACHLHSRSVARLWIRKLVPARCHPICEVSRTEVKDQKTGGRIRAKMMGRYACIVVLFTGSDLCSSLSLMSYMSCLLHISYITLYISRHVLPPCILSFDADRGMYIRRVRGLLRVHVMRFFNFNNLEKINTALCSTYLAGPACVRPGSR